MPTEKSINVADEFRLPPLEVAPGLRALTIRAPWAWAIATGVKRVENRGWRTSFRGRFALHAGTSDESDEDAAATFAALGVEPPEIFVRGAIIGTVELVDVLPLDEFERAFRGELFDLGFALGPFCWVLREPRLCAPLPCPGNFQFWSVERALARVEKRTAAKAASSAKKTTGKRRAKAARRARDVNNDVEE